MNFLDLLARVKCFDTTLSELQAQRPDAIYHDGVTFEGLWPSVNYLLQLRPYPDIVSSEPKRRGVIFSMTQLLLEDPSYFDELDTPEFYNSLFQNPTCMLSIAVAAHHNTALAVRYPWIDDVHNALRKAIDASPQEVA